MSNGKVAGKRDPHGGVFSTDGKPTTPILMLPADGSRFVHYSSGVVDFRWLPSAGQQPISYDVELDLSAENPAEHWFKQNHTTVDEPYLAAIAGGMQPHRWRVRAKNALNVSPWSKYSYFEITE